MKGFLKVCLLALCTQLCLAQTPSQSAVASSHPLATQAGIEIMRQGGNAFDAAITVAAVLALVEPSLSGFDGAGIWLLHDTRLTKTNDAVIDVDREAKALVHLATHYGKLPLSKTLAPAIELIQQKQPELAKNLSVLASQADLITTSKPLISDYHSMQITTVSLPSFGGIELLIALNILADFELTDLSEADQKHLIVESLRRAQCDQLNVDDVNAITIHKLISKENAQKWRDTIKMNHATPSSSLDCKKQTRESEQATHYVILDQQGNSVSATLSLHQTAGSYTPISFEIPQGRGILGTSGNDRIPSIIMLSLLTALDDYYPETWMLTPRYFQSFLPDEIEFEPEAFPVPLQNALRLRGHTLKQVSNYGNLQAIFWDKKNNKVYAASDPRGKGLAIVERF